MKKVQVSDFIVDYLQSLGVKHVFLITGAAIAFTVDSFKTHKDIKYICMNHEQAAAMAADAYSRMGPGIGVAMGTSGPGATNLITGICCAWFDSIPTLFITGQVNTKEQSGISKIRQLGFQETKIVDIVKPITKYAYKIEKPNEIKYQLEKAVFFAKSKRPGPVLIDIPINIQYAHVELEKLRKFTKPKNKSLKNNDLDKKLNGVIDLINKSHRPVILAGFGNHIAACEKELKLLAKRLKFPIVTTWSGLDLFPFDEKYLIGQSGVYGSKASNFTIQNSDLLISIGARLDTRQTGGKPKQYARRAKKIIVDIDSSELYKNWVQADIAINCDAKLFIQEMLKRSGEIEKKDINGWLKITKDWKQKYPILQKRYFSQKKFVNPYVFGKELSDQLLKNSIIITDTGGSLTWTMQSIRIKNGQRLFSAFGNSPMGYALPASIGACFASGGKKPIICITGDGGLQVNIQELQTVMQHKLPVKIFVLNNNCYGIIKQFQDSWLGSRYEASQIGYSTPDFPKVAKAYGFTTFSIERNNDLKKTIGEVLRLKGPAFCDVFLNSDQKIIPKVNFGKPLEDMEVL